MTNINNELDLACEQGLMAGREKGTRELAGNRCLSAKPRPFRACSQVTKDSGGRTVRNPL